MWIISMVMRFVNAPPPADAKSADSATAEPAAAGKNRPIDPACLMTTVNASTVGVALCSWRKPRRSNKAVCMLLHDTS